MARLAATVYVKDPDTHQWVTCEAGTAPASRLAALILTPCAWEDGAPPGPPPAAADTGPELDKKARASRRAPAKAADA